MKKLPFIAVLLSLIVFACSSDDDVNTWEEYATWRETNTAWLNEQMALLNEDGTPYYTKVVPEWNTNSFVLIHWFNDRSETEGNLSPLSTSTIDVRYQLHLYNETAVDSSNNLTAYGAKGIYRCKLNEMIPGWVAALAQMRCGDTAQIIVPYELGYNNQGSGAVLPFSTLRFNVRLEDIPYYELEQQ